MTTRSIALGLVFAALAGVAQAQTYPTKPVHVYVTSTTGGPLDLFTRLVTNKMEQRLKQPFVVENRAGAGGNLGISSMLQAPPDGYAIAFSIDTTLTVNPHLFAQMPFDVEKDVLPVSVLAKFGQALAVPAASPVKSVHDLKTFSLQRDINYASAGNGSPSHLSFAYLQAVVGIKATHVPYRGNPPALLALADNEVQAAMVISTSLLPFAADGKVRILAYSDTTRSEVIPDVPTVVEQGYKDFQVVFSYVLLVPPATPKPVVDVLFEEATRGVMSPDVRQKLKSVDTVPIGLSTADSIAWLRDNRQKWRDVIAQTKIQIE
jgi:tripartite-type tricarboxylate transporter receptor subunit TctC